MVQRFFIVIVNINTKIPPKNIQRIPCPLDPPMDHSNALLLKIGQVISALSCDRCPILVWRPYIFCNGKYFSWKYIKNFLEMC